MLDYLIKGGTVVDGTGAPSRTANVGVKDGRIVAIGTIDDDATTVLDATGLVVAPGFVDPHTHYDGQLFWDPAASPSNVHGVTTVFGGNCGFTLAPIKERDADYIRRMMQKVEGMPLEALENGVPWTWETFGEYLGALDGRIGVNAGFLVGHCAIRRYVMGEDSVGGQPTEDQLTEMVTVLKESLAAGGLGFSTTLSHTHSDGNGDPVPSRSAPRSANTKERRWKASSRAASTSSPMTRSTCLRR
jgi:N-acyl-D-aspartate/D-glutamate deacylase